MTLARKECDFSKAGRGKFFRKRALLRLPIYLDANLQGRLQRLAQKNHVQLTEIVQRLLKKEVQLAAK